MTAISDRSGTPESAWQHCQQLHALPEQRWSLPAPYNGQRIVAVAPHPDDETLGVGGTLSTLWRCGYDIEIVALTDGEASHPHSPTLSRRELGEIRAIERLQALACLGLEHAKVHRLRLSDGALQSDHELSARISEILRGACLCIAPYRADGHPDHDAAGHAAVVSCANSGIPLIEYLIWAWHWTNPEDTHVPWTRARRVTLSPATREAKHQALAAYRSQCQPLSAKPGDEAVLSPEMLEHFDRPFEVLLV